MKSAAASRKAPHRMKLRITLSLCIFVVAAGTAWAGDAVAIGYNKDGVWTSVSYYSSGTAKGGSDYKDEAGAREEAIRDLKKRGGEDIAQTDILASSDKTAHVVYARGKTDKGEDKHAVAYGSSEDDAKDKAFADLKKNGATKELKVFYHY